MYSLRIQLPLLVAVLVLFSCSNSDTDPDPESNFYALAVGNSWEYKWYGVSNEGNQSVISVEENISITGVEDIGGNVFYKFSRVISGNPNGIYASIPENGEHIEYYRDSLGFLINDQGLIKFANSTNEEFPIIYYDNFGHITDPDGGATLLGRLSNEEVVYELENESLNCLLMTTRIEYDNGIEALANNHIYYSNGIGLVSDDIVWVASENNAGYRRVLVNYNIP
ncbi:hypothetical protein [Winogradskyella sp. 3972H.M.0a.05]|uniref:hypothetical protein n=1 Tax=Winogradskyella sp. 3972H.M.0a.05 TaxID=2950277 RepID=UPI0033940A65